MSVTNPRSVARSAVSGVEPYLFAYDAACPKRGKRLLKVLRRWRVDGQYSVHETLLRPAEMRALAVELLEEVDASVDRLLVGRLSRRGHGPVYQWHPVRGRSSAVMGGPRPQPIPPYLHSGHYLLAYDVTCPRRLQRVHRVVARGTLFLQKSVYWFQGEGDLLGRLVQASAMELKVGEDDLRLYALAASKDLLFLCGGPSAVMDVGKTPPPPRGPRTGLLGWIFGR